VAQYIFLSSKPFSLHMRRLAFQALLFVLHFIPWSIPSWKERVVFFWSPAAEFYAYMTRNTYDYMSFPLLCLANCLRFNQLKRCLNLISCSIISSILPLATFFTRLRVLLNSLLEPTSFLVLSRPPLLPFGVKSPIYSSWKTIAFCQDFNLLSGC
jgi:hypothetical protein